MRWLVSLLIIVAACSAFCCTHKDGRITGIKIYDYHGDFDALADKWAEMGINTSFVSTALAANDTFRKAVSKRNISVFIIFPVFQNPEILKKDSTLYAITSEGLKASEDWVHFVCPSREQYRKLKVAEAGDLVKRLHPDGISIDFIRQFVFWEMIYPDRDPGSIARACYCDSCLALFSREKGIFIPDSCLSTVQKALWLDKCHPNEWDGFRCELITSMVKEIAQAVREASPGIIINFHAVPWRDDDFGGANIRVAAQDLKAIATCVDYISPMCYSQMVKHDAKWIADVVSDMDKRAEGKILLSVQVFPYYIDRSLTTDDFRKCVTESLRSPSRGCIFFSWPLFERDSSRMEAVKEILRGI